MYVHMSTSALAPAGPHVSTCLLQRTHVRAHARSLVHLHTRVFLLNEERAFLDARVLLVTCLCYTTDCGGAPTPTQIGCLLQRRLVAWGGGATTSNRSSTGMRPTVAMHM